MRKNVAAPMWSSIPDTVWRRRDGRLSRFCAPFREELIQVEGLMREIVLDTETTGLDPATGDRVVEIACVEIVNTVPTGATFHVFIDPQRDMPEEAFRVHGLSSEFLKGKPLFDEIVDDFLSFIGEAPLVIHNAEFDI